MIDIETKNERNLKNIRQIGTPTQEDKIYIENAVYARIHEEDYAEKKVFVFMGHTECIQGRYTTFIEAAIPVLKIEFVQNAPQWNNRAWSDVFREVKRSYENSIIVGWAMDQKGYAPSMTPELEAIHREQFGGAHQVLFLMDSIEGEESFYINKGNWLQKKEGFYIFYARELRQVCPPEVVVEMPKRARMGTVPASGPKTDRAQYRKQIKEKKRVGEKETTSATSYAMTAAVALLIVIVGLGVVQDRIHIPGLEKTMQTIASLGNKTDDKPQVLVGTEIKETEATEQEIPDEKNTYTETLDLIPIESIAAGDIKKMEDSKTDADSKEERDANVEAGKQETQDENSEAGVEGSKNADQAGKVAEETDASVAKPEYYTVKAGDTLTSICRQIYGSTDRLKELKECNNLENADDLRVDQKLLLP